VNVPGAGRFADVPTVPVVIQSATLLNSGNW
jgi:hypothetical protein